MRLTILILSSHHLVPPPTQPISTPRKFITAADHSFRIPVLGLPVVYSAELTILHTDLDAIVLMTRSMYLAPREDIDVAYRDPSVKGTTLGRKRRGAARVSWISALFIFGDKTDRHGLYTVGLDHTPQTFNGVSGCGGAFAHACKKDNMLAYSRRIWMRLTILHADLDAIVLMTPSKYPAPREDIDVG
ncbi:hypothetical protein B0H13DRAFT_2683991 [Mycena leptocephala]|nr:hypothetical protein B0H13DRAFT_2683991 [Mycena leptocephala]